MLCSLIPGWILWPCFLAGVALFLFGFYVLGALAYSIIMDNPFKDYGSSRFDEPKDVYGSKRRR